LTVGETYFFRDKKIFESLEEVVLPELINSKRKSNESFGNDRYLRIWCAGCATGEEPYSISILLHKLLPDINEWKITLLATDINPHFLKKMEAGIYNEWSFCDVPDFIKQKYFKKTTDNHYKILDDIKKIVAPMYLNLAEDCYPSLLNNTNAMDIIICRNVLMYFTSENSKKVVQGFYRSLIENGWLIVSPSETSHILFNQYSTVKFPGAIFYRKESCLKTYDTIYERTSIDIQDLYEQIPQLSMKTIEDISFVVDKSQSNLSDVQSIGIEEKSGQTEPSTYLEAQSLFESGKYFEAKEVLKKYFQDNYNDPNVHSLLTRIYANEGNLREAFAWCEKAISLDRMNPVHHYLMASILQEQNRFEEAIASLKRALYLDQNFVIGHFALGNISAKLGKGRESKKSFNNALNILQKYPPDFVLTEADGMTAKRLIEIIQTTTEVEVER
jgi:chemotaxis protein methyltransferase CheR